VETDERARELLHRLREFNRLIRTLRQHRAAEQPAVPLGMVGLLMQIEELTDQGGRHARGVAGCHAKELAARAGLDPSTVSRMVAALVAQGLLVRRTDPADRRASFLVLTDAGRAALATARDWYVDLLARGLADWHPTEVTAFASALGRFVADIQRSLDGAAAEQDHSPDTLEAAR
jgi:DNA-binding MarR family transcriptional regulator